MTVVSNTSPVSNLAIIERLELLREQFSVVLLSEGVGHELEALRHPQAKAAIQNGLEKHWLQVLPVIDPQVARILQHRLDLGEAETIALALERNADLVLIDETEGRESATTAGLRVRGTLGVLRQARQSGQVASLKEEIRRLRQLAHFFIAAELEAELLKTVGEKS